MAIFTTACPRNCYSTCTMSAHVEDGRLRRLEPHASNRATPEGPCLKGLSYLERVSSPDRILHPLRRRGDEFVRISWEEAFAEIVEQLQRVREERGPQSVLYYAGSGTKGLLNGVGAQFWRLFGGYTTTYGDLCWPAGLEATRLTLGDNKHNAPWDLENAHLIVMWGKNTAETNIHQGVFVERALQKGAHLVVIDPRRTQTAERAELLIQPRPGTDGALALALAQQLFARDQVDHEFLERYVLGHVEYAASLAACTPQWAARVCEIPVEQIERLAELMGSIRPMTINAGFGMQRYSNSGQAMRAMIALLALTGNLGRPGAGWIFADLQSHIFDEVKDPIAFFPPEVPDGIARVSISTARLGEEMLAQRDPPLKFAWVERGNPVTQNPDTNRVLEAFRALDFRVVVEQFLTDTAREADIVLPAKSMFEQSDVINAYWHPYIQIKQKLLEPPGEVKPESEIYWELAGRLGIARGQYAAVMPAPGDAGVEAYLRRRLEPFAGLSLEALREGPMLPPGHEEVAFADGVYSTPSGKIELSSEEAVRRWQVYALPSYEEPVETVREGGKSSGPASSSPGVASSVEVSAADAPLHFMTPNTKNRIHSQFNNLQSIRAFSPGPTLQMHPQDALARGLVDGQRVRVFNQRGQLTVPVRLDLGIKVGCIAMTNGWWASDGGSVNLCSLGRETDMAYGAAFHENLVQVEAAR